MYSLTSPCWLQHKHQKVIVTSFLIPYGLYLSLEGTFKGLFWELSMYFLTCAFLIKQFLFRWGMFCSDAVCCSHGFCMYPHWLWVTTRRQNSLYHELYICYFAPLSISKPCFRSRVCSRVWLSIKAASGADCNWALFSEVPEAGSPPRKACVAGSSLSLHLIIQPVWDYNTLPHHVLVINYFPHLPKSVPVACNQLNEHHSTYIITHVCGFPSTASRLTYVWLPKPASTFSPGTCAAYLLFSLETPPRCLVFLHISLFPYFGFSLLKDSQKWSYWGKGHRYYYSSWTILPRCFLDRLLQPLINSRMLTKSLIDIARSCSCDILLLLTIPTSTWKKDTYGLHLHRQWNFLLRPLSCFPKWWFMH